MSSTLHPINRFLVELFHYLSELNNEYTDASDCAKVLISQKKWYFKNPWADFDV